MNIYVHLNNLLLYVLIHHFIFFNGLLSSLVIDDNIPISNTIILCFICSLLCISSFKNDNEPEHCKRVGCSIKIES